jgi:hypothetical protein
MSSANCKDRSGAASVIIASAPGALINRDACSTFVPSDEEEREEGKT